MKTLPNHLEDYKLTFYNEVAAYGDCCRGPVVFVSQEELQRLAAHLEGLLAHMSQESRFIVNEYLRQKGALHRHEAIAETARATMGEQRGQALDFAKLHTIWGDQCLLRTLHHDGACGQVRCAIHAYALRCGLSPLELKPVDCWLWPLALIPLYSGQFLLTVHTEETRHFTEESESYANKRCLTEPMAGAPSLYQSFRDELIYLFGQQWYETLVEQAAPYHVRSTTGDPSEDRACLQWHHTGDAPR